jgi:hypothetical protein
MLPHVRHTPPSSRRIYGRALLAATLLAAPLTLTGCFLFAASQEMSGEKVTAQYTGLPDKSIAIVIYTDQATTNEFPAAREELSSFIAAQIHEHIPTARMLDYHEVINWQDDTLNWFGLTEKEIGKHFSVDRVLYIELLDYSISPNRGYGDLQGHIRAECKVFETDSKIDAPAWTDVVDVSYPKDHPLDASQASPEGVRSHTLADFSDEVVKRFYDHQKFDQALKDQP